MTQLVKSVEQAVECSVDTFTQPREISTPSLKQPHLPLTQANLRLLRSTMDQPLTPQASTKKSQSKTSTSADALETRQMLQHNNVLINNRVAQRSFPHVFEWAKEISNTERHSPNTSASAQKTQDLLDRYGNRNEDTFLRKFWGKLFRESRDVKDEVEEINPRAQLSDLQPATWTSTSWDATHLDENWKQPFQRARGPDPTSSNNLNSIPNSIPDIAYGLSREAFTSPELGVADSLIRYTGISKGIVCPGMLVEAKTAGNAEVIDNQCARAGALTVRSMRHMLLAFGDDSVLRPGAETKTAVFSLSLIPMLASFHVHWAEVKPTVKGQLPLVIYHMHSITGYYLQDIPNLIKARQTLNSILDWVSLARKNELKTLFASRVGMPLAISVNNVVDADDEDNLQTAGGEADNGADDGGTDNDELALATASLGFSNGSPSKKRKVGTGDQ